MVALASGTVRNRRLVYSFGVLTGLFAAGYGVMFSMLDDFRDSYGITGSSLGLIVAVGFFSSFVAQVVFGPMADRGHAKRLVYIGMALDVIGLIAMAAGRDEAVLLAARVVMGLGAGIALPAIRRIVILADPGDIGANVGRMLSADVAGFALGPAISAILVGPFGIASPFLVIAAATVACLPMVVRADVLETPVEQRSQARFAFDLLRNRTYVGACLFGAAVFLMIGTFDALWVLVLDDLNTADWIANLGITLFALPLIFLGAYGGRMAERVGPFRTGSLGLLLGAGFMFSYGQLPTGAAMFAVSMVHALSDGLTVSSAGVAVGLASPPERQAGAQGLLGGIETLVGGAAALIAGSLYEGSGRAVAYTACAVAMVILVIVALMCAGRSWSARPVPVEAPSTPVPAVIDS